MISLKEIEAKSENGEILLKDINVEFIKDSVNLVLGANGAGKTTLAKIILGDEDIKHTGKVFLGKKDITKEKMYERAKKGIFLAHQSPVELSGVKVLDFLHSSYQAIHDKSIDIWEFYDMASSQIQRVGLDEIFLRRNVNEGLSGGEKKKFEVFQMLILKPKVAILDEIDSGLDIDSIKNIFEIVVNYQKERKSTIIIISHNTDILKYISPAQVILLDNKSVRKKGGEDLAKEILENGYVK